MPNSTYDIPELLKAFERGPERLRLGLSELTTTEMTARPGAEKWSIREVAAHLTDSEIVGAVRIRQTFAQSGSTYPFYDQEIWTTALDYQNFDDEAFEQTLKLFEYLRSTTAPIFRRAGDEDWLKSGFHPERGAMTLLDLLENYATHSEGHIRQILRLRAALGKPLELPAIL